MDRNQSACSELPIARTARDRVACDQRLSRWSLKGGTTRGLLTAMLILAGARFAFAAELARCESKEVKDLAYQAIMDDFLVLRSPEKDYPEARRALAKLHEPRNDRAAAAVKRELMRQLVLKQDQIRVCHGDPIVPGAGSPVIVLLMTSPVTGGLSGLVIGYGAGGRAAPFGDPMEKQ